jgi:hypothetical protein
MAARKVSQQAASHVRGGRMLTSLSDEESEAGELRRRILESMSHEELFEYAVASDTAVERELQQVGTAVVVDLPTGLYLLLGPYPP